MTSRLAPDPVEAARTALRAGAALEARELLEAMLAGPAAARAGREGAALVELGNALEQSGDYPNALARFLRGHEQALLQADTALQARALLGMAKVDHAMGDSELAATRLGEAVALAAAVADPSLAGDLFHQLGMMHTRLDQGAAAQSCYARSLERKRALGDLQSIATTLNSLGVLYLNCGNREPEQGSAANAHYDTARRYFDEALAAARACGDAHLEALALGNVGTIAGSLGDLPLALDLFGQQLAALRAMGDLQHQALALTNIGEAHRRGGAHAPALAALGEALALAERIESAPRRCNAHLELSRVHEAAGDPGQALQHFKAYHRLDRQIRGGEAERKSALVTARFAVDEIRGEAEAYRAERDRLRDANEVLAAEALTDALTGLDNRRSFDRAIARALRRGPLKGALALLDLDRFKQVNDVYSHLVGDQVLRRVGALVGAMLRPTDSAFRLGGEEFGLLLSAASAAEALAACERIRQALQAEPWDALAPGLVVTASFGLAMARSGDTPETLAARADAALYAAKGAGRNRVSLASD